MFSSGFNLLRLLPLSDARPQSYERFTSLYLQRFYLYSQVLVNTSILWKFLLVFTRKFYKDFVQVKKTCIYKWISTSKLANQIGNFLAKTLDLTNQRACVKLLQIWLSVDCISMKLFFNLVYFNNLYLQVKTGMIGLNFTKLVNTSVFQKDLYLQACEHKFLYFS